ncbi:hypothetical protein [Streptomyces chrestomyceticus]|uniref:hypothetical protein n=1 Tax=Streptomyces chrestomyceticus TaxID=68185 RepID=UPI003409A308
MTVVITAGWRIGAGQVGAGRTAEGAGAGLAAAPSERLTTDASVYVGMHILATVRMVGVAVADTMLWATW